MDRSPRPDLPGFSGAGEGVHACSADSIATKILGLRAWLSRGGTRNTVDRREPRFKCLWNGGQSVDVQIHKCVAHAGQLGRARLFVIQHRIDFREKWREYFGT